MSCSVQGLRIGFPMVRLTIPVCAKAPLVAVMINGYLPVTAVPGVTIRLEEPVPVTAAGLNEEDAPEGIPLTPKDTAPLKPSVPMTDTAKIMFDPEGTAVGDTDN